MSRLPFELYNPIVEHLYRDDLLRVLVVSRAFQIEAERLLYDRIVIDASSNDDKRRNIPRLCSGLLSIPRIWPYVREVCILEIKVESTVISSVAGLLEKSTNLDVLDVRDGFNEWPSCGDLFKNCSFQLNRLTCHFQLDKDFVSFLDSQKSLDKFEWVPRSVIHRPHTFTFCELPPSALQNLRVYSFLGEGDPTMGNILHDRPIGHFRTSNFMPNRPDLLRDLKLSRCTLKSLNLFFHVDATYFCLVTEAFPRLEYLAIVDLTIPTIKKAFFSQVLPSMKYLRRLFVRIWSDSAGSKTDVIKKIHVLCPSLRVIHIQIRLQVQQSVYDWEERSKSWILSPSYRDIWAEAIHEIDVAEIPS